MIHLPVDESLPQAPTKAPSSTSAMGQFLGRGFPCGQLEDTDEPVQPAAATGIFDPPTGTKMPFTVLLASGETFTIDVCEHSRVIDAQELIKESHGHQIACQQLFVEDRGLNRNEKMASFYGKDIFLLLHSSPPWATTGSHCVLDGLGVTYAGPGCEWNLTTSSDKVGGQDASGKPRKRQAYWEVELAADSRYNDMSFDIGVFSVGLDHNRGHFRRGSKQVQDNHRMASMPTSDFAFRFSLFHSQAQGLGHCFGPKSKPKVGDRVGILVDLGHKKNSSNQPPDKENAASIGEGEGKAETDDNEIDGAKKCEGGSDQQPASTSTPTKLQKQQSIEQAEEQACQAEREQREQQEHTWQSLQAPGQVLCFLNGEQIAVTSIASQMAPVDYRSGSKSTKPWDNALVFGVQMLWHGQKVVLVPDAEPPAGYCPQL